MNIMQRLSVDSTEDTLSNEVWKAIDPVRRGYTNNRHPAYAKLLDAITAGITDMARTHSYHLGAVTNAVWEQV